MLLVAIGFAAIASMQDVLIWTGMLLAGIGGGLMTGEVSNIAIAAVPAERSDIASGINVVFRHGSFTVGIAILGGLLAAVATRSLQAPPIIAHEANSRLALGDLAGAAALLQVEPSRLVAAFENGVIAISIFAAISALLGAAGVGVMPRRSKASGAPTHVKAPAAE